MNADSSDELIYSTALAELAGGAMSMVALSARLRSSGVLSHLGDLDDEQLALELDEILLGSDAFWTTDDGTVASTAALLDGANFCHRLTKVEREHAVLDATPDLVILDFDVDFEESLSLAKGGELQFSFEENPTSNEHGYFVGPFGWLNEFHEDDTVVVSRFGNVVSLHAGVTLGHGDAEAEALRQAFDHHYVEGVLVEPTEILLDALCQNPSLFRAPVPPISELLERAGLECRGAWVGRHGESAKPPGVVYHERKVKALGENFEFDRCCYVAFDEVLRDWRANTPRTAVRADARVTARALAHGVVAPAFAEYVLGDDDYGSELLDAFTSPLIELSGKLSAPGHYLRALNTERDGHTLDAESHLRAAVGADPGYPPALFELSWYVADRGDAPRALSLLRRSGVPDDDPQVEYLTSRLDAPIKNVGRNEICPCGSGRKFKVCCANGRPQSLQQHAEWLCHKITVSSLRPQNRWLLESLVDVASHVAGTEVPSSYFPILMTVAAFESFALEKFIETRGALLPDVEIELARTWLETRPSLWQVVAVAKESSLELRDTRTGERVVVAHRAASEGLSVGDYLLARVVPVGSTWLFTGDFLLVPLMHRASLLELFSDDPDAQDIAAWIGRLFAPIQMANYEGEDVVLCRAVLAPVMTSWEHLSEELDRVFRKSEDGQWTEFIEIKGTSMVRTFLRRDGDTLVIQTNSVERFERVLKVLREEVGEFEILDEERTELSSLSDLDAARTQTSSLTSGNDEVAPEVLDVVRKLIREKEDAWLDESIPALRGLTPRQAAADPTRREDLIALLNEFDRHGEASFPAMTFDVARLRRQLGLAHS